MAVLTFEYWKSFRIKPEISMDLHHSRPELHLVVLCCQLLDMMGNTE